MIATTQPVISGASRRPRDFRSGREFDAVPLLTVFLALVSFIPARWVVPGLGAAGRPASLFGMGLFGLWCLIRLLPSVRTQPSPWRWILFIDAIVLGVTFVLAQDRGLSAAESTAAQRAVLELIGINGVVLMAAEGLPTAAHIDRLTKRMTYFAGIIAALGLVQFFARFDPFGHIQFPGLTLNGEIAADLRTRGSGALIRARSSTLHPIEFAIVMALSLPIAVHHALHEVNRVLRVRRFSLAALIATASLLAISRTAILAVGIALIMMFWAWAPKARLVGASAALVVVAVMQVLVPGLIGTLRALFTNLENDPSISGRTDDYAIVGPFIRDRPWFGRGIGTFIPEEYILLDNAYLGRILSTGFVGLATLALILTTGFVLATIAVRNHPSNRDRHLASSLRAMVLVTVVGAATFDFFSFPTATSLLMVALGCTFRLAQPVSADTPGRIDAPKGLMRLSYRVGYVRRPWWHRFDPELRDAHAASGAVATPTPPVAKKR